MANHQAAAQMLGYLYQVRCALDLLLSADNEQLSICIEKFDDIAFSNDSDSPEILIQTKHHVNGHGDLTNSSTDLWRTLNVWFDYVSENGLENIKFIIITTALAPDGSAAFFLRRDGRDDIRANEILKKTATQSINVSNKKYYDAFLSIDTESIQTLLQRVTVIDRNENILDVVGNIRKSIRYSVRPEFEDRVFERIEGWWFKKSIEALSATEPTFISQRQVRSVICDISAEYTPDNLPIDTEFTDDIDIDNFPQKERIFCEQLRLIAVGNNRMKLAIRDYYRAFTQRNNSIKDDLLYITELDKYEKNLVDEWQHLFVQMEDEVDSTDEKKKQEAGRDLYTSIENKDLRIRSQCSDAFVMRGSYHMLANKLKVGWHLDFVQRLESLVSN